MNTSHPQHSESYATSNLGHRQNPSRSSVSWGAILVGTTAGLALYVLLMMLVAGLGLAIYSPATSENPVANLSVGALIIHSICVIVALLLGGWVAGRFTSVRTRGTAWLHGFSVWCAATVGGVLLTTLGAGSMLGGLSNMAGSGVSAAGQTVAGAADGAVGLAMNAMEQSGETIESFVDEAVSSLPENAPESERIRATREVGFALARLFNPARDGNTAANRADAVNALVEHTEMSQAEAEELVADWTESYERLQADLVAAQDTAATHAREAADSTASALSKFSLWSFVGFLLGAIAAAFGGQLGAKSATSSEEESYPQAYVAAPDQNV